MVIAAYATSVHKEAHHQYWSFSVAAYAMSVLRLHSSIRHASTEEKGCMMGERRSRGGEGERGGRRRERREREETGRRGRERGGEHTRRREGRGQEEEREEERRILSR